jgi:hypothetical protein
MKNNIHRRKYIIGNAMKKKKKNLLGISTKPPKNIRSISLFSMYRKSNASTASKRVPNQKLNTGFVLAPTSWRKLPRAALERRERTSAAKLLQHS